MMQYQTVGEQKACFSDYNKLDFVLGHRIEMGHLSGTTAKLY
jgi:hypothetical protein